MAIKKQIKNPYIRFGRRAQGPYAQNLGGGNLGRAVTRGEQECFFIASAQIGNPWPDQIYITYNEPFNDTTCSVPGDWTFLYQFIPFDSVTPQPALTATVDSWLVENTLEGKDGASPEDPITLSYTPGTCAKDGEPTCALGQITNRSVTNNILGPTSLEIGNVANNIIVVDYPVDIITAGSAGTWSAESDSGPLTVNTVSIVGGNVHLTLSADVAETDFIFVTHDPVTTVNGAQGSDARYSYKYFGREAVNNVDSTAPTVPQNLVATATGQTTISLAWDPSTDAKSGVKEYVVYRASVEIDRVPHPTTTYDDSGLSPETAYSYTVSAVDNKDNESAQSASDSATTFAPAPNVTAAEVGNVADNIVVVTFDREVVATDYAAGWSFTENGSGRAIQSANKTAATEVRFTLTTDISNGTTVAYNYNSIPGNYENTDGVDMGNQSGSVANNTLQPAPNVTAAEVGNVADNIIVVTFDREVNATDYAAGWSFTEDLSSVTIQSANKTQPTEVQFTLTADISFNTAVAYDYASASGNYENTDGVDMGDQSGSVTNNVAAQPAPLVVSAEVGNVADNIVVVTFDREVVSTNYQNGWSFTEDASPVTISSANKTLATEVQFTLSADISDGTTVAYDYQKASGDYENTDGVEMENQSGSVTNNVAPPVTDPTIVGFSIDTADDWIKVQTVGTGTPSFARASGGTVEDFENITKECQSGELRIEAARRVENPVQSDFITSWFGPYSATISYNVSDPDGGTDAVTLTAIAGGGRIIFYHGYASGEQVRNSMWVRRRTGSGNINMYDGNGATSQPIAPTGTWQRFAMETANASGTNDHTGVYIFTSGDELDLYYPQTEWITGQSNQNPGESVSLGLLSSPYHGVFADGVAYPSYQNANTVSSRVVTEAKGAALTTDWGALFEPARTNYADGADDLSGGAETVDITAGGTGDYTLSVKGSAAVTVAAGTATGTGFGQATAGNPVTFNITAVGTVTLTLNSGTLTKVRGLALKQVEKGSNATSFILTDGATGTRTADDGSGMFAYSNFDNTRGTFVIDIQMKDEGEQGLLNFANAVDGVLAYKSTTKFTTTDGTNTASVDPSLSANLGDVIRISVLYSTVDGLRIGYRNITDAGSWVWDTDSASFDGAFATNNVFNVAYNVAVPTVLRDLIHYADADVGEAFIEANY